jgi:hypothetical protein
MLHIHNGDSTAGTLREFGFPGEHLAFQEILMEGPTPGSLSPEEWVRVRAKFLAEAYELRPEDCEKDLLIQQARLARFTEHDETILWFEHDLFCQINLIYLFDWFSKQSRGNTRLSLVCIGEFHGKPDFRGLGELTGEQLASLFERRHKVVDDEFELATRAWAAYRANHPEEITRMVEEDTTAMPFLGNALRLHLTRFPSVKNGLNRIEEKSLEMISGGAGAFKSLFPLFNNAYPVYGMGDSQFWSALKRLGRARTPLITISGLGEGELEFKSSRFHEASFELTETGRAVLGAERDFIDINGIDLWLGGVHIVDGAVWRWDEQQRKLVHDV